MLGAPNITPWKSFLATWVVLLTAVLFHCRCCYPPESSWNGLYWNKNLGIYLVCKKPTQQRMKASSFTLLLTRKEPSERKREEKERILSTQKKIEIYWVLFILICPTFQCPLARWEPPHLDQLLVVLWFELSWRSSWAIGVCNFKLVGPDDVDRVWPYQLFPMP